MNRKIGSSTSRVAIIGCVMPIVIILLGSGLIIWLGLKAGWVWAIGPFLLVVVLLLLLFQPAKSVWRSRTNAPPISSSFTTQQAIESEAALRELFQIETDTEIWAFIEKSMQSKGQGDPLLEATYALMDADSSTEIVETIQEYPILLSDEAEEMLKRTMESARRMGIEDEAQYIEERYEILRQLRKPEMGLEKTAVAIQAGIFLSKEVQQALREMIKQEGISSLEEFEASLERYPALSEEVEAATRLANIGLSLDKTSMIVIPILRELYRPVSEVDPAHRIELCSEAIKYIDREQNPELRVDLQIELANNLMTTSIGDPAENIERAIESYWKALELITQEVIPIKWASVTMYLGIAYLERIRGKRAENIEQAIHSFQQAMEVMTRQVMPLEWARTSNNLAIAYLKRVQGDRVENIELSIEHSQQALEVTTRQTMPRDWAKTMSNLATAYTDRIRGDRADNVERAIEYSQRALEVITRQTMPRDWAKIMMNLATAYTDRIRGDRVDNVERAIDGFRQAMEVMTRQKMPVEWAMLMSNMGAAYLHRGQGDRAENIEQAIENFQQALEVMTRQEMPIEWAITTTNLASAYQSRIRRDRAENIEQAIKVCQRAIDVLKRQAMPVEWATTMMNLGNAYVNRKRGFQAENIERAIECYQQALEVRTRQTMPAEWATTMMNLGNAYYYRGRGDREQNIERAIECYQQALEVQTSQKMPVEWAVATMNLANAYSYRRGGVHTNNIKLAIEGYRQALEVFKPDFMPDDCRRTAANLGSLLFEQEQWAEAYSAYQQALQAAENLYQSSLLRRGKDAELVETFDLYHYAAYALAQTDRLREAVLILEQGRARGLTESLARDYADLAKIREIDPIAYEHYHQAATRLRRIEASERATGPESAYQENRLALQALHQEARQATADIDVAIGRIRCIEGYENFMVTPDWNTVAAALHPGWALVYLLTTSAGSLAIILCQNINDRRVSIDTVWADCFTSASLDQLLTRKKEGQMVGGYLPGQLLEIPVHEYIREAIQPHTLEKISSLAADRLSQGLKDSLDYILPLLGEQFLGAIATRLRLLEVQGAMLVPSGKLGLLPLHATRYEVEGQPIHILDEFDVAYVPNARVWQMASTTLEARQGVPPALAGVGNPLPHPRPLPFARTELEDVATLFAQESSDVLFENEATREALLERLPDATHVHLACHGIVNLEEPLVSRLELADREALTLGQVLDEIAPLLAQTRLVVLSACQSAIPDFRRLPDEVIGLPTGFLQAGVPGVVGTLWSVNDLSTALLMVKFYEYHLQGDGSGGPMPPVRALRLAQRWLRDVTAGKLLDYFQHHRSLHQARRQVEQRMPEEVAIQGVMRFSLEDPDSQPFVNQPYHWAPFVFVGV